MVRKVMVLGLICATAVCLSSCGNSVAGKSMTYDELMEAKASAESSFSKAQAEYQSLFSGSDSSRAAKAGADDEDFDNLSLEDKITLAAWKAYNSGDDSEVVALLKENNLYDKCQEIMDKYNLEEEQNVLDVSSRSVLDADSRSVTSSFMNSRSSGDIVLCYGGAGSSSGKLLGLVIPGHWKHAGIIDKGSSKGLVLSASNETDTYLADSSGVVGRVGWETAEKWAGKDGVVVLGVNGATAAKKQAAINYGAQYSGKPYNLAVGRYSDDGWYCSKVVFRSFMSQGFDLEYNTWNYIRGPWVTPQDLYDDNDTYYIAGDKS